MKHQGNRKSPSAVYPPHKQENNKADDVQNPTKITEKLDHRGFSGELLINGKVELIIHDRDDHIGDKGQKNEDLYQHGFLHQRQNISELLHHRRAGFGLFALFIREQKRREMGAHTFYDHSTHHTGGQIGEQKIVKGQHPYHKRGSETSEDLPNDTAGRDQGKQPFGLPCVEKVIGQIPEQERKQHFILGF